jgi:hypothetical protein
MILVFVLFQGLGKVAPEDWLKFLGSAIAFSILWLPLLIYMALPLIED